MAKKEAESTKGYEEDLEGELYEQLRESEPLFLKEIDLGKKLLGDTAPELRFWLSDGRVIKNLDELIEALRTMKESVFEFHANKQKNDFSNWIRDVLGDKGLAEKIRKVGKKEVMKEMLEKRKQETEQKRIKILEERKRQKSEIENAIQKVKEKKAVMPVAKEKIKGEYKKPKAAEIKDKKQGKSIKKPVFIAVKETKKEARPTIQKKAVKEGKFQKTKRQVFDDVKGLEKKVNEAKPLIQKKTKKGGKMKAKQQQAMNKISDFSAKIRETETSRKLSDLRKKLGLEPLKTAKKEQEKKEEIRKSKVMIKSPKIREDKEMKSLRERERELNEKEKWINGQEEKLNQRRLQLSRMRIELIRKRNELEKEKFENFVKRKSKFEDRITKGMENVKADALMPADENYEMRIGSEISKAKELLSRGMTADARSKLAEIKSIVGDTYLEPEQKRKIEYELMELEADVKLAML